MDAGQRQRRSRDVLRARQSRLNLLSLRVNARLEPPLKRAADRGAGDGVQFTLTSSPARYALAHEYLVLMITLQITLHNTHRMNHTKQDRTRLSVEDQRAKVAGAALLG
jgi:hypothetical protein